MVKSSRILKNKKRFSSLGGHNSKTDLQWKKNRKYIA